MKAEIMKTIGDAVLQEIGEGYEISFSEVTKNNRSVRQAIVVRKTGDTVCPVIYIDELLNEIEGGRRSIRETAKEIAVIYWNTDIGQFSDITEKLNKKSILEKVVYQLVNTERNIERLDNMPHKELFDMSAIYRVIVRDDRDESASIAMNHELCNVYDISEEELDFAARKNTKEKGFCVMTIAAIMAEITGIPSESFPNECPPMFILTNTSGKNGTVVMLFEEYFEELARKLKSDLYVMPSSIHEVIATPTEGLNPDILRDMVEKVNAEEVPDEEILGESIYKYDVKTGKLELLENTMKSISQKMEKMNHTKNVKQYLQDLYEEKEIEYEYASFLWSRSRGRYEQVNRTVPTEQLCRNRLQEYISKGWLNKDYDTSKVVFKRRTITMFVGKWEELN